MAGAIEGVARRFIEDGFTPEDALKLANERASAFMTPPESQTGKAIAQTVGDFTDVLPPILGGVAGQFPSLAQGARGAKAIVDEQAFGLAKQIPQRTTPILPREKRTQALIQQIQEREGRASAVGKGIEPRGNPQSPTQAILQRLTVDGPRLVDRPLETNAVSQGYDRSIIGIIGSSTPETKIIMEKMLADKEFGMDDARFDATNRPSNHVGDALMSRVNVVIDANRAAGKNIGRVAAQNLKGKEIDIIEPITGFSDSLDALGISLVRDKKGGFAADYEASVLPKGDRGAINEVIRVMNIKGRDGIDALTVHEMKRILDNHISYGKSKDGLSREAESALKEFRVGLDNALDSKFPEYDAANASYAETITALDRFQEVAGKKLDLSSPTAAAAAGQEMRKLLSNYGTRQRLTDAVNEIETVASKYKGFAVSPNGRILIEDLSGRPKSRFKDSLLDLVLFDNELDARFTPSARGGFENLATRKAARNAIRAAASPISAADIAAEVGSKAFEKVKGVTDKTAFKSMRELLKGTK
jgi:hypothetical protein